MANNDYKERLQRFETLVKDLNSSGEMVSEVLQENGIDEKAVATKGKALAQRYIGHQAERKEGSKFITVERRYWLSAAAVFIFVAFSLWLLLKKNGQKNDEIFTAYYAPYPNIGQTTRSLPGNSATDDERSEALEAYDSGNYPYSIKLFNKLLSKGNDEEVLFYLGNAYLSNNEPREAENTFISYLKKYKEFTAEAKWYLCLSYIKQGKIKEATPLLAELAKQNNEYRGKAREILRKW